MKSNSGMAKIYNMIRCRCNKPVRRSHFGVRRQEEGLKEWNEAGQAQVLYAAGRFV